ncbi:MAG TPA: flagellar hook assembly protein FlgD [Bacillales bacterium]|nr:flagellar hook assembly protein FlgD [Bacillales bacterium]
MINRADESLYLWQVQQYGASERSLGKNDFLQLLVTQLQNQSPLDPMKDKAFISQMATFSTLEQMTNLNQFFKRFLQGERTSSWLENAELIGKQVSWLPEGDQADPKEGIIASVRFKDGEIQFEMMDGTVISKDQMIAVGMPKPSEGEEQQ